MMLNTPMRVLASSSGTNSDIRASISLKLLTNGGLFNQTSMKKTKSLILRF